MKNKKLFSIFLVSLSTFVAGVLSYFYHPIMVRFLDVQEFAEFESLLGVINLFSVFVSSFSLYFIKEYVNIPEQQQTSYLSGIRNFGFFLFVISVFFYLLLAPFIAVFLRIDNFFLVFFVGLVFSLSFLGIYQTIFFQTHKAFSFIAFQNVLNPFLRLIFWFFLVFLNMKVFWALWGFVIAQIVLLFLWVYFLQQKFQFWFFSDSKEFPLLYFKRLLFSQKKSILNFFFSSLLLAILMNMDILLAKHFFDFEQAWIYAWISVIAKFLVFVGMSIELVYYPDLVRKKNISLKTISFLVLLYFAITFFALLFFFFFWKKFLYFFKPGFEHFIDVLYLILIYCGWIALLNLFVKLLIAFEKFLINYILFFFLFVFLLFMFYQFQSGVDMFALIVYLNVMLFFCVFCVLLFVFFSLCERK